MTVLILVNPTWIGSSKNVTDDDDDYDDGHSTITVLAYCGQDARRTIVPFINGGTRWCTCTSSVYPPRMPAIGWTPMLPRPPTTRGDPGLV
jgi:hypothetical protein